MKNNKKTIYIAGDSTAEAKPLHEKPMSGWGEYLNDFFDSTMTVSNHAMGGRSTKSFLDEKRLDVILGKLKEGDYLLIQFGHNDQKIEDPLRYTEAFGEYQENLKLFISKTREKKAIPILLSSISRRLFENGKIDRASLGDYPKAMEEVSANANVIYIDANTLSADYLDELGIEKSKDLFLHLKPNEFNNYPEGLEDNTHFSEYGGRVFAKMIANELLKNINK